MRAKKRGHTQRGLNLELLCLQAQPNKGQESMSVYPDIALLSQAKSGSEERAQPIQHCQETEHGQQICLGRLL